MRQLEADISVPLNVFISEKQVWEENLKCFPLLLPLDYEIPVGTSVPSYNFIKVFITRGIWNYSMGTLPMKNIFSEYKVQVITVALIDFFFSSTSYKKWSRKNPKQPLSVDVKIGPNSFECFANTLYAHWVD